MGRFRWPSLSPSMLRAGCDWLLVLAVVSFRSSFSGRRVPSTDGGRSAVAVGSWWNGRSDSPVSASPERASLLCYAESCRGSNQRNATPASGSRVESSPTPHIFTADRLMLAPLPSFSFLPTPTHTHSQLCPLTRFLAFTVGSGRGGSDVDLPDRSGGQTTKPPKPSTEGYVRACTA